MLFQANDGIRDVAVTGVQTCALPISFCLGTIAIAVCLVLPNSVFAASNQAENSTPQQVFDGMRQSFRADKDRKSTRLNSSHGYISYAVFCLKKKKNAR